jgi:hypothetical protein
MKSHQAAKMPPVVDIANLKAPVEAPGRWVLRDEFPGRKSFGCFECKRCRVYWTSAHAQKQYLQACKRCNTWALATYMWVNDERNFERRDCHKNRDRPHDSDRCMACRVGECDVVGGLAHVFASLRV